LAGFSKGKADVLRKAMGKKDKKLIDDLKADFMAGAREKGFPDKVLEKIYGDWEEFAQYAFNKSHSTCYAVIAFQTAYLKANYPAQYMAAVLKSNMGDIKKITFYMEECRRMDMKVLGPDLNESNSAFTVTKTGQIRFGMNAVKGIGEGAVLEILADRDKNGPFESIFDLTSRVNLRAVNKRNLENMAKSGVFDFDKRYHRAQYVLPDAEGRVGIELAIKHGQKVQSDKISGQTSLFGGGGENQTPQEPKLPNVEPYSLFQELKEEEELIGVFLSKHPLDDLKFLYSRIAKTKIKDLSTAIEQNEQSEFRIMGVLTSAREMISQKGNPYGILTILDYTGSIEIRVFSKTYMTFKNLFSKDYIVIITGNTETNPERSDAQINVKSIQLASEINEENLVKSVKIEMTPFEVSEGKYQVLQHMIEQYPGNCSVIFNFNDVEEQMSVALVSKYGVKFGLDVEKMLDDMNISYNAIIDERWQ
jgi:DNA polymerase-3 subunit alpha